MHERAGLRSFPWLPLPSFVEGVISSFYLGCGLGSFYYVEFLYYAGWP